MRRASIVVLLLALSLGLGLAAVACGGEESQTATPETVAGGLPTETETTETTPTETETDTTATETTETETETETEPAPEGDATAGKAIFLGASGCGACHTLADAGTSGTVGPNLDETQPSYELAVDRIANGLGGMPPFSGQLTEQQIADVAAYVSEAAGS